MTFTATDDAEDDDDETVELSFGALPDDVSEGSPGTTIVTIVDNDDPAVTVSFDSATYAVTEGWTVDVMVTLERRPRADRDDSSRGVACCVRRLFDTRHRHVLCRRDAKARQFRHGRRHSGRKRGDVHLIVRQRRCQTDVSASGQTNTQVTITDDDAPETGGLELSALAVTGGTGSMYPVFNPRTYHYALRCPDATTLRVTATARDASHQLTLNNIPVPGSGTGQERRRGQRP